MDSYAPFFYQALGTIRTIHAKNYDDTVELTEPQSLSAAASDLELVWHSACGIVRPQCFCVHAILNYLPVMVASSK